MFGLIRGVTVSYIQLTITLTFFMNSMNTFIHGRGTVGQSYNNNNNYKGPED